MSAPVFATVPRLWPNSTIVCVATGPSLTQEQVDFCRDKARVITINDAFHNKETSCLWADVLYGCDAKWWKWRWKPSVTKQGFKLAGAWDLAGLKYSLHATFPGVQVLKNLGGTGLSLDPRGLKTGHNSGYQAINLAVLLGAARIVLLGYDMKLGAKKEAHCFGAHPDGTAPPFPACLKAFPTLVDPLQKAGVEIINCTPGSALKCFPMGSLEDVLVERAA